MIGRLKPYIYIFLSGILVGLIGIFVKLIGNEIHFTTLVFYRVLIGFVFVLIFVPFLDKGFMKITKNNLIHYFVVGFLLALTFSLFTVANLFAPVQNVVLITNFAPFLVIILGAFFLREKITKEKIITLIIASIGIFILNPFRLGENSFGNTIALVQALTFAILIVVMRKENKEHSIGSVVWFFFFAMIIMLPFPFIFGFGNFSSNILWYVLFLGILSTGLAYLLQSLALQKLKASISSIIIMISMPLSGIFFAFLILDEALNIRVIIGGIILICAGVYLQFVSKDFKHAVRSAFGLCAN